MKRLVNISGKYFPPYRTCPQIFPFYRHWPVSKDFIVRPKGIKLRVSGREVRKEKKGLVVVVEILYVSGKTFGNQYSMWDFFFLGK